jgi:glutamyl-tRNA reductase
MTVHIFLIGLDHRTSPVEIRERLALTGDGLRLALQAIQTVGSTTLSEAAILVTCNRSEVYLAAADSEDAKNGFDSFVQYFYGIKPGTLDEYLYEMVDDAAIHHLMRVAAGLESMMLGEPQIQGQVARAHSKSRSTGAAGVLLNRLFEAALRAGKRARSETPISQYTTSVSHAAALLAAEKLDGLSQAQALIIGAGEMATQAGLALNQRGISNLMCISRTMSHAESVVDQVGGQALNWIHLPEALSHVDVVISATSAPHVVLRAANVIHVLPERNNRPLLIIDIAVPRDVEEAVGDLPGVALYDIDDLQSIVDENLAKRQAAIPLVEEIIQQEMAAFQAWLRSREVVPAIVEMRRRAEAVAETELARTLHLLDGATPETQEVIRSLAHRIVQQLLHDPTTCLKTHAQSDDSVAFTHMVRELFALDTLGGEQPDE